MAKVSVLILAKKNLSRIGNLRHGIFFVIIAKNFGRLIFVIERNKKAPNLIRGKKFLSFDDFSKI